MRNLRRLPSCTHALLALSPLENFPNTTCSLSTKNSMLCCSISAFHSLATSVRNPRSSDPYANNIYTRSSFSPKEIFPKKRIIFSSSPPSVVVVGRICGSARILLAEIDDREVSERSTHKFRRGRKENFVVATRQRSKKKTERKSEIYKFRKEKIECELRE